MADGAAVQAFRPRVPAPNTRPLGTLEFFWKAWRDPLTLYQEHQFEEPYFFSAGPQGAILNVTDPAGVKHVLLDNYKNYGKGDFQRRLLGELVSDGLFLTDGDQWRRQRRVLAPLFTPARLARVTERMLTVCEHRVSTWPRRIGVVHADHEMTTLTFEIISDVLFSNMLGGESETFERAFNVFVETTGRLSPLDFMNVPGWLPRPNKIVGRGANAIFEKRIGKLVRDRQLMIANGDAPDDLLTALINARDEDGGAGLSDREVLANVLTFIVAGHETTARALAWALYLLARTPHYQDEVAAEAAAFTLDNPDWERAMPWTRAVLDETMRLFPPAPSTMRVAREADVVCGQPIPAGCMVMIAPYLMHRHRARWDDPNAFKPERFLPGAREKIDRFAYMPFSGGPRICIGAAFAIQEAMIALAVILRGHVVSPLGADEAEPVQRLTLRAKGGIKLAVRKRD
jgi:cytochrome P450